MTGKKLEATAAIPGLVSYRRSLSCCTHHYNSTGIFSFAIANYHPVLISPSLPHVCVSVCVLVAQSCLTLYDPMDCGLPGSSVHGILQARILEWVAIPVSRTTPNPGIEPESSALQAGSLASEPIGKLPFMCELTLLFRIAKLLDLKLSGLHRPQFNSVLFSHSVVPNSLRPHELQHARPPCSSPTPGVHSNSHPSSQ